jgi:addiction module RelB/DinJ family antitoxin
MNTVISVKVDKATKEAAQAVAKSMGLNLSVLINAYLKQVIVTRRVELYAPEQMSPKLEKQIIASLKSGVSKNSFATIDELMDDLSK